MIDDHARLSYPSPMGETAGRQFLYDLAAAAVRGQTLETIAADVDGFTASIAADPAGLGRVLAEAAAQAGGMARIDPGSFATAACTRRGIVLACDPLFSSWQIDPDDLRACFPGDGSGAPRLSAIAHDRSGRPVALAFAAGPRAAQWPLASAVRAALAAVPDGYAILGVPPSGWFAGSRLFGAWAFTNAETRIVQALIAGGDLRKAARAAGIAYETARETIASAMSKTGAQRQPELVRSLTLLAMGELPAREAMWRTFADAYSLSARQAQISQLIALGATRAQAAAALGVTLHVVKSDLKLVFERCHIDSAPALGRLVAEIDALTRLASAADVEIAPGDGVPEPLRFVRRRRAAGRIAVQDHGPAGAMPVVYFHTPTTGRHMPAVLVAAMQARGLRPISLERPGFGLTTEAAGDVASEAVEDLADVFDALGLEQACLLGRSCVMPLRFAAAYPERMIRGVLLSTSPPGMRPNRGLFGKIGDLALDTPGLVENFTRVLVGYSSDRAIAHFVARGLAGCPADLAAFADPANRHDYIRATRQLSTSAGLARELALHAAGVIVPKAAIGLDWTVLIGALDALVPDADTGKSAWERALPGAKVTVVPDAGRFLHLSHPALLADALAGA